MRAQDSSEPRPKSAYSNRALIVVLVLWAATMAAAPRLLALPDDAAGTVTAIFAPGAGDDEMLSAVAAAGGRILRNGLFSNVLVVHDDQPGFSGRLKRVGAWSVLSPRLAAGCFLIPDGAVIGKR